MFKIGFLSLIWILRIYILLPSRRSGAAPSGEPKPQRRSGQLTPVLSAVRRMLSLQPGDRAAIQRPGHVLVALRTQEEQGKHRRNWPPEPAVYLTASLPNLLGKLFTTLHSFAFCTPYCLPSYSTWQATLPFTPQSAVHLTAFLPTLLCKLLTTLHSWACCVPYCLPHISSWQPLYWLNAYLTVFRPFPFIWFWQRDKSLLAFVRTRIMGWRFF